MFAPANKAALSYIPLPARLAERRKNISVQFVGFPKGERCDRRQWRIKGAERVAAVDKIEDKRKPDDFIGYRNRKYAPLVVWRVRQPTRGSRRLFAYFLAGEKVWSNHID